MWRRILREYFAFSRQERKGIWLLLLLVTLLTIVRLWQNYDYVRHFRWEPVIIREYSDFELKKQAEKVAAFEFTPKKSITKWEQSDFENFGLSAKVVEKLMIDIHQKKYFNIDSADYLNQNDKEILEKHCFFPTWLAKPRKVFAHSYSKKEIIKIDLNAADSLALESLPFIGPSLSSRILQYRNRLGGFHSIQQLKEVYGLDSMAFVMLQKHGRLEQPVKPILINVCSFEELAKHPYVGYKLARIIVNYRLQHGDFNSAEDLKKIHVMNAEILRKIELYLQF